MLAYLVSLLLNAGLSSINQASTASLDKRQTYYSSCLTGGEKYLFFAHPQSPRDDVQKVARKSCDEMMIFIEKSDLWDKVDDPANGGCLDFVQLSLKDKPKDEIAHTQNLICGLVQK